MIPLGILCVFSTENKTNGIKNVNIIIRPNRIERSSAK